MASKFYILGDAPIFHGLIVLETRRLLIAQDGAEVYLIFEEADARYCDYLEAGPIPTLSCIPTAPGA